MYGPTVTSLFPLTNIRITTINSHGSTHPLPRLGAQTAIARSVGKSETSQCSSKLSGPTKMPERRRMYTVHALNALLSGVHGRFNLDPTPRVLVRKLCTYGRLDGLGGRRNNLGLGEWGSATMYILYSKMRRSTQVQHQHAHHSVCGEAARICTRFSNFPELFSSYRVITQYMSTRYSQVMAEVTPKSVSGGRKGKGRVAECRGGQASRPDANRLTLPYCTAQQPGEHHRPSQGYETQRPATLRCILVDLLIRL